MLQALTHMVWRNRNWGRIRGSSCLATSAAQQIRHLPSTQTAHNLGCTPFVGQAEQLEVLRNYRRGETDLVIWDGDAYLVATVEVPEQPMNTSPAGCFRPSWRFELQS